MGIREKLHAIWGWKRGARARTLLYHSISDDPSDPLAVSPRSFVQQMEWLVSNGFQVISTKELATAIRQHCELRKTIVLTFDDALLDFFDVALPILRQLGLSATVFVPTGKIGQISDWSFTYPSKPLMSERQLTQAMEMGFELGSHTVTHATLPTLAEAAMMTELRESFAYLKQLTGKDNFSFAYPYGCAGQRERAAVMSVGYTSAYIAGGLWGNGKGSDLFWLTRDVIYRDTSLDEFASLINGYTDLRRALLDINRRLDRNRTAKGRRDQRCGLL